MFRVRLGGVWAARTGRISNETKIGRLAKMFSIEVLKNDHTYTFSAFGDNLLGLTVKAVSLAQTPQNEAEALGDSGESGHKIFFTPKFFDTVAKRSGAVPSVEFHIGRRDIGETVEKNVKVKDPEIFVAATMAPAELGKRLHSLYLKRNNQFRLRCIGIAQASTAAQAMATFNENVNSHTLSAYMSTELVTDRFKQSDSTIRAMVMNVVVEPTNSAGEEGGKVE